ncbi:ABC transporter ATP-binding protein [Flavobacterium sp.]|jgi:putative ABC transport system ATP-binding protein|uniref:ABC transporter ATP-binding protein n=1 Tax=Flavobacterium sp. TaxID=239 RepID=UPI0037C18C99
MILTKGIGFQYNSQTQFQFPNLQCESNQALLITGASGKGKTTLLHVLGGLLKPTSGEIYINNVNICQLSSTKLDHFRGQNIGLILQKSHFIAALTVLENIELASWLTDKTKKKEKAKELLSLLGLDKCASQLPQNLSVGQQQRVSIARALINEPKLLLADEPTSSLDNENAKIVGDLLAGLAQKYNAALVIVTHDQRLKERFKSTIEL